MTPDQLGYVKCSHCDCWRRPKDVIPAPDDDSLWLCRDIAVCVSTNILGPTNEATK